VDAAIDCAFPICGVFVVGCERCDEEGNVGFIGVLYAKVINDKANMMELVCAGIVRG
jgi:hypothetical protein